MSHLFHVTWFAGQPQVPRCKLADSVFRSRVEPFHVEGEGSRLRSRIDPCHQMSSRRVVCQTNGMNLHLESSCSLVTGLNKQLKARNWLIITGQSQNSDDFEVVSLTKYDKQTQQEVDPCTVLRVDCSFILL